MKRLSHIGTCCMTGSRLSKHPADLFAREGFNKTCSVADIAFGAQNTAVKKKSSYLILERSPTRCNFIFTGEKTVLRWEVTHLKYQRGGKAELGHSHYTLLCNKDAAALICEFEIFVLNRDQNAYLGDSHLSP